MKHQSPFEQANKNYRNSRIFQSAFILLLAVATSTSIHAQAVSGIITDYNGFWKTTAASNNSAKPSNSHNLLSFTYNGNQYSTGVNDQALANHGENFVASDFWSLPLANMSGAVNGNTKIAVGEMYDGVHNGASNPAPVNDISFYLTDGIKGLNIGTGVANLPAGTMSFNISAIKPQNIGDGIPDILVTQIADPGGATDSYSFVTSNGTVVGHKKDIAFTSITPVGKWTADFYEASTNPLTLTGGYTNTDRDLRLWAADLSDFGITAANYQSITKFTINLSGNSDVAFVAYNNMTFTFQTILPLTLTDFSAKPVDQSAQLKWTTATETNTSRFIVERSTDNKDFEALGTVNAAGNSSAAINYSFTDKQPSKGINYYRLKMMDADGKFEISKVVQVKFSVVIPGTSLFPNPCASTLIVNHPSADDGQILVYNTAGVAVLKMNADKNTLQTKVNMQNLQIGMYYIVWQSNEGKMSMPVVKN